MNGRLEDKKREEDASDIAYDIDLKNGTFTTFLRRPRVRSDAIKHEVRHFWIMSQRKVRYFMTTEHGKNFAEASLARAEEALTTAQTLVGKGLMAD